MRRPARRYFMTRGRIPVVDSGFSPLLFSSPMRFSLRSALFLAVLMSLLDGPAAIAQSYSAGAAGSVVYSGGSGTSISSFGTWGAQGSFELQFEPGARIQVRAGRFGLSGSTENSPNLKVDHLQLLVSYLFKDTLADIGFVGGVGGYRLRPNDPEPGQIVTDPEDKVFGLTIGLVSLFHLDRHWDVRLEGTLHYLYTEERRSPILLTGGVAYNF
ncbi:MAG: hypothetical protein DIJKHBIC_01640 [Thermoanaerobaculia bacterium]|nr:hypothetical protein [Thermoanaerobaculia bacterium]